MNNTSRLSTDIINLYALDTILPEHLKGNTRFIEFIQAYFDWEQSTVYSPGTIVNTLSSVRNVDVVADEFLQYIQKEVAGPIPNIQGVDRRKLYKQIVDVYLAKGSLPSFESLFNLLYADQIELYFPRVDMLKLSDGKYNVTTGRYGDNGGFLSDRKKLQDSYYYQDYSYVIKTSKTYEVWKDIVTKILHPAGFIFFGQINVISIALNKALKSPLIQPGEPGKVFPFVPIILDLVSSWEKGITNPSISRIALSYRTLTGASLGPFVSKPAIGFGPRYRHLDQYKFILPEFNDLYGQGLVGDAVNGAKTNRVPDSYTAQMGEGYILSTILLSNFLYLQPADLNSGYFNDVYDLEEPVDRLIETDFN